MSEQTEQAPSAQGKSSQPRRIGVVKGDVLLASSAVSVPDVIGPLQAQVTNPRAVLESASVPILATRVVAAGSRTVPVPV